MKHTDFIQLSKTVSHALRHEPESYGLKLDKDGWVLVSDLINGLRNKGISVEMEDIYLMIDKSEKKRHQINDDKIRAYYGHSTCEKITKQLSEPPELLYHGTTRDNYIKILKEGLLPMQRQYVHLSIDRSTAREVAKRWKGEILVYEIRAKEAFSDGVNFYKEHNGIWLAELIPNRYLRPINSDEIN